MTVDSSTLAEILSLYEATKIASGFRNFNRCTQPPLETEYESVLCPDQFLTDSNSVCQFLYSLRTTGKSKHWNIKLHFLKNFFERNFYDASTRRQILSWRPRENNIGDFFTHILPKKEHWFRVKETQMIPLSNLEDPEEFWQARIKYSE